MASQAGSTGLTSTKPVRPSKSNKLLSKLRANLILDQNGHEHEICTQDLTPRTHQNHCQFVSLTPLRSVRHVKFDPWFNVMPINVVLGNTSEIISFVRHCVVLSFFKDCKHPFAEIKLRKEGCGLHVLKLFFTLHTCTQTVHQTPLLGGACQASNASVLRRLPVPEPWLTQTFLVICWAGGLPAPTGRKHQFWMCVWFWS